MRQEQILKQPRRQERRDEAQPLSVMPLAPDTTDADDLLARIDLILAAA